MKKRYLYLLCITALFTLLSTQVSAVEDLSDQEVNSITTRIPELEEFITKVMEKSKVPGMSLVVVEDGKPILVKGYGVKTIHSQEPINAKSLFAVGSITKPMTTMLIAKKIDEGLFTWDTPVKKLYPKFSVLEKERQETLTIEDLVCNCSGYTQRLFVSALTTKVKGADKLFRTLSLTKSKYSKEAKQYAYINDLFAAAGFIVSQAPNPSYENYAKMMKSELFDPIGMHSTTANIEEAWKNQNIAIGHRPVSDTWLPTNVDDMVWLHEMSPACSGFFKCRRYGKISII